MGKIKCHIFIYKKTGYPYCYSEDSKIYEAFKVQRNMNLFTEVVKKFKSNEEYDKFKKEHIIDKLNKIPLNGYKSDLCLIGTQREENYMDFQCNRLLGIMIEIRKTLSQYELSEYQEYIDALSQIVKKRVMNEYVVDQILMIDTYDLFTDINMDYIV